MSEAGCYTTAMHRILIALMLAAGLQSCKKQDEFAAQNEQLEVYKREVAPTRSALRANPPSWLGTPPECPTEALPKQFVEGGFNLEDCANNKIDQCLERCKGSVVAACYSAALILQDEAIDGDRTLSTPLFARACKLGHASACTNWGSSLDTKDPNLQDCLRDTFGATCKAGKDPWGCTMYSYMLASEGLDDATLGTIRSYEPTACRYGEEDPACKAMRDLLKQAETPDDSFRDGGSQ